jgi:hypothetical protein
MRRRDIILALVCGCVLSLGLSQGAAAAVPQATLRGAFAVAPPSAPAAVKAMIKAGNRIRHKPYKWGGGHGGGWWSPGGYDCSGSVSYVLHAAGLLDSPLDSRGFMRYGAGGGGAWVSIYANNGHAYTVIAGLRFDTSQTTDGDRSGPGWSEILLDNRGFRVRHPLGLLHATPLG